MSWRARAFERLEGQTFDLLVVGAGIVGSRIAYEAARAGARVALVDAGDFGGATSSASSKLIHGGLRYLPMGDVRLVREAHQERRALVRKVAPHLVHPLPFLVPIYRGGPHLALTIGAGVFAYSALSGFQGIAGRLIGKRKALSWVPSLRSEGLKTAAIYEDAQTNDGRLVLANVAAAAAEGTVVLNHARVSAFEAVGGRLTAAVVETETGPVSVRMRSVVNAAGPWVDQVRRLEDPAARDGARLSKGVHLTLPLPEGWNAALAVPLERLRVAFAVPWEGLLLLGTTDTEYEGDPSAVTATDADVDTVLREAAIGLPADILDRSRILATFAGLRVLPGGRGDTATVRRGHMVTVGASGMVSVAGGKLTTHRQIAVDVLRHVDGWRALASSDPLPGGGPLPPRPEGVEPDSWRHLVHVYGDLAGQVAGVRERESDALEQIHPDGPDLRAQITWAREREWAISAEDVVRRRTTLELRGLATPEVRAGVAKRLQPGAD